MRINSITIGDFTATANQVVGSSGEINNLVDYKSTVTRRISSFELPGQHGGFVSNALYGMRIINITVKIKGSSIADFKTRVNTLFEALDITENAEKTITIVDTNDETFFVTGYPSALPEEHTFGERKVDEFTFEFLCEDYRYYSSEENSEIILLRDTSGGFSVPLVAPDSESVLAFGESSGGSATLTNNGQIKAYPILRLFGPLTEPTVENVTTAESIQYFATIATGEYVDIDMQPEIQTATDQDGNNVMGNLSTTFRDFWGLQTGANDISFYHNDAYNADGKVRINWNDAYINI